MLMASTIPVRHISSDARGSEASPHLVVKSLNERLGGRDLVQPLHRHSFYFILIVEKGSGEHSIDFIPYSIVDGSVFIVRPGQVHALTLAKDAEGFLVRLPGDFYTRLDNHTKQTVKKACRNNCYNPSIESLARITSFLTAARREIADQNFGYEQVIHHFLQLVFIELLRQNKDAITGGTITYSQERLEAFQDLIADHFTDQKQAGWYARQLNLSAYQLNAITKASLEITSSAVINEYIVLEAKRQLLATSDQVTQISWHLGYQDVSYFIRFFKKHTGYAPEAFRVKYR
jgi:AraC family transcriptional activator of pobA